METLSIDIGGVVLSAFSIDPKHNQSDLELIVKKEQEKPIPDLTKVAKTTKQIGDFNSFDELCAQVSTEPYRVPRPLQVYREALGMKLDSLRKIGRDIPKNGPVAIVDGNVEVPLRLKQGGYYDWSATMPDAVPYKLEEELQMAPRIFEEIDKLSLRLDSKLLETTKFNLQTLASAYEKIKGVYAPQKTVREILSQIGISEKERGRYLGCAHILFGSSGKEWIFIQRAKNLGVAADCMASPGSTPDPRIRRGFNLDKFMKTHLDSEAEEEFGLEPNEFNISGFILYDDSEGMPFMATRITTPLSAREIAERCYGNPEALKEHTVIYSVPAKFIGAAIRRLPLFPVISYAMNDFLKR